MEIFKMNKVQKIPGILSSQELLELINKNIIISDHEIEKDIIQPASIDLRLGIIDLNFIGNFLSIEAVITPSDFFNSFNIFPSGDTIIEWPKVFLPL